MSQEGQRNSKLVGDLLAALEEHSVDGIERALDGGIDPSQPVGGKTPINCLIEMWTRSDAFPACLRVLLDRGAVLDDPSIAPVLLNDANALHAAIDADAALLHYRATLVSAFTPLVGASLLHVAAEYGNLAAAGVLLERGADVNAAAAVDEHGLNGHTPLFHTVNSNRNRSLPILELLLQAGARADVRVQGIAWGRGFPWETILFDVSSLSYAQFGLLPQVHRNERDIYANVVLLLEATGRPVPPLDNVPNRYLLR